MAKSVSRAADNHAEKRLPRSLPHILPVSAARDAIVRLIGAMGIRDGLRIDPEKWCAVPNILHRE